MEGDYLGFCSGLSATYRATTVWDFVVEFDGFGNSNLDLSEKSHLERLRHRAIAGDVDGSSGGASQVHWAHQQSLRPRTTQNWGAIPQRMEM